MNETSIAREMLEIFPWGRLEGNGTCYDELVLAKFSVLGGNGYGFWSRRGGDLRHFEEDDDDQFMINAMSPASLADFRLAKEEQRSINFLDGGDLLKSSHLTDEEGWKLPTHMMVRWQYEASGSLPPRVADEHIVDWRSWHSWRQIPSSSPVSLIMHHSLTLYWMLVNLLKITYVGRDAEERVKLTIHYLGAERELNFLPTFSELILLLPNHDIDLVMFGPCVFHLGKEASKDSHRNSLVYRSSVETENVPIYTYQAPEKTGTGRLRIFLHTTSKYWDANVLSTSSGTGIPDAVVAFNAGLFTYDISKDTVLTCAGHNIPFAVTDYCKSWLTKNLIYTRSLTTRVSEPRQIMLNPFHRPGQRYRLWPNNKEPNLDNGFGVVVTPVMEN